MIKHSSISYYFKNSVFNKYFTKYIKTKITVKIRFIIQHMIMKFFFSYGTCFLFEMNIAKMKLLWSTPNLIKHKIPMYYPYIPVNWPDFTSSYDYSRRFFVSCNPYLPCFLENWNSSLLLINYIHHDYYFTFRFYGST